MVCEHGPAVTNGVALSSDLVLAIQSIIFYIVILLSDIFNNNKSSQCSNHSQGLSVRTIMPQQCYYTMSHYACGEFVFGTYRLCASTRSVRPEPTNNRTSTQLCVSVEDI